MHTFKLECMGLEQLLPKWEILPFGDFWNDPRVCQSIVALEAILRHFLFVHLNEVDFLAVLLSNFLLPPQKGAVDQISFGNSHFT